MIKVRDRYARRPDSRGWTVYDIWTGEPVAISLRVLSGLDFSDACEIVQAMNRTADAGDRRIWQ